MIRKLMLAAAVAATLAGPAWSQDPRVKEFNYSPGQVYRIVGVFRTATQVIFSPGEEIAHIALGDTVAWEVAAEDNILFVKPREKHKATNLIVTTKGGGETRNYLFELSAREGAIGRNTPDTYFQVRFRYPQDEAQRAIQALGAQAAALERVMVDMQLSRAVVEGRRNWSYSAQGSGALQPTEISDNGQFTLMRFPANRELPTVYTVTPDGKESLIPFDVRKDFIVVHTVARQFRLKRGRERLCIFNDGFDAYGVDPGTNTASPAVERTNREGARR